MSNCNGNLYRFVAGFGAVLFLAGIVFFLHVMDHSRGEKDEALRKMVVYSHEREVMIGKLKANDLAAATSDSLVQNQAVMLSAGELAELKEQVDRRTKELDLEQHILDDNGHLANQILWFVHGLLLVGVLFFLLGILLWYLKIQRFENRLVRLRAQKEMHEKAE